MGHHPDTMDNDPSPRRTGPLASLALRVGRSPRATLLIVGLCVVIGAVFAIGAPSALSPAGYEVSDSESTLVAQRLADEFDAGAPNVAVLASARSGTALDAQPVATDVVEALVAVDGVRDLASWQTNPALRSVDGRHGLVLARIVADEDATYDAVRDIRTELDALEGTGDVEYTLGGTAAANLEVVEVSERDLLRAELIVFPLTTIVLLLVFRSVVAALLPLIVSLIAVVGTAVALRALSDVTLVSIFGLNLASALGLGMAVDYSLFLINRWREERRQGLDSISAVHAAVQTAGRSILFSGLTTAGTLGALLVFDYPLFRSLALAGFIVVLLATFGALVALPAAMFLLGDRIDAGTVRRPKPARALSEGRWYRLATFTMRRPVTTIAVTLALLLVAGSPFLRAEFSLPDDRVLPATTEARQVADAIRSDFPDVPVASLAIVIDDAAPGVQRPALPELASRFSSQPGIRVVETADGVWVGGSRIADATAPERYLPTNDSSTARWLSAQTVAEPLSTAAADVVRELRAMSIEGVAVEVGGESARLVDNTAEIASKIPIVLLWIAVVISVLLFVSFRSLLVPIKAFVLNLVSLTASFGAIVWIFQDGRLADLLGYTPTGLTDAQTPVLMFCIAFGLSMDYEVFLLSRIKEEWDDTGDPRHSVAAGLQRTGGIISAAGVLMAIVFLSFATGDVTFIQMVGMGLAIAIVVDVFIVRTLLVPSFMALAGAWNWWLPGQPTPDRSASTSASIDLRSTDHSLRADELAPSDNQGVSP